MQQIDALADEPLIFVAVAVFHSISNCQPGLRGVPMGHFLIRRVAEQLKRELPQLKAFCTLSPIPGLILTQQASLAALPPDAHHALWRLAARHLVHRSPRSD